MDEWKWTVEIKEGSETLYFAPNGTKTYKLEEAELVPEKSVDDFIKMESTNKYIYKKIKVD